MKRIRTLIVPFALLLALGACSEAGATSTTSAPQDATPAKPCCSAEEAATEACCADEAKAGDCCEEGKAEGKACCAAKLDAKAAAGEAAPAEAAPEKKSDH